jgi:hypothetical protein
VKTHHNFLGFFFSIAEKQIHQVVKFHHQKHCHYLLIYLFIYIFKIILVGMGIGNEYMGIHCTVKRVPSNKMLHIPNEWDDSPPLS